MFNKEVRPGDIILWSAKQKSNFLKNIIYRLQKTFDGEVRHAEMVYSYSDELKVAKCFGSNFDGVKFRAHCIDKPYVAIIRPLTNISRVAQSNIDRELKIMNMKGHLGYDTKGMVNAAVNSFLSTVTFGRWKKKLLFSSVSEYYCSEAVAYLCKRCYYDLVGKDVFCIEYKKGGIIPNSVVSPADLYKASKGGTKLKQAFLIVKDFEI
jgi:hypothetical protein